jgi:hypothetical protein
MKLKKTDYILLGTIIFIGVIIGLVIFLKSESGNSVQIRVNGDVIADLNLNENQNYEIKGADGATNLLIIKDGKAWIKEASCPDGLCINMGKISQNGQSVICLPNKVVVEIISDTTEADDMGVDIIVGK